MKRLNIIWSHPREHSLTGEIVRKITEMAKLSGYEVETTDLYRSSFSPVLNTVDEPDWNNAGKKYSPEVTELAAKLSSQDPLIFVFPVWWYSLPAMLKGYLDRVWNNEIFYGENTPRPASKILWIGLVGQDEQAFSKRGFDFTLRQTLNNGVASFCGVDNSAVKLLFDTLGENVVDKSQHYTRIITGACDAASEFLEQPLDK